MAGHSQSAVARQLGLSFQQIQKYEKGANRISAGRLYRLSKLFGVPVSFFYDDLPDGLSPANSSEPVAEANDELAGINFPEQRGSRRAILRLVRAYLEIPDQDVRGAITDFVTGMARAFSPGRPSREGQDV